MPLINCPDCGKEISSSAKICLGCGMRFRNRTLNIIGLVISLILSVSGFLFVGSQPPYKYFSLLIVFGFAMAIIFARRV